MTASNFSEMNKIESTKLAGKKDSPVLTKEDQENYTTRRQEEKKKQVRERERERESRVDRADQNCRRRRTDKDHERNKQIRLKASSQWWRTKHIQRRTKYKDLQNE